MTEKLIAGIDISKKTLDVYLKPAGTFVSISNDLKGFKKLITHLQIMTLDRVLVVMEHTGRYSYRLESFLTLHGIGFCKISALQIKRSLGVIRGKDDKIDARRIAEYAWLRKDTLQADVAVSNEIVTLRSLLSTRQKLVRDRSAYKTRLKEMKCTDGVSDIELKVQQRVMAELSRGIERLEAVIKAVISKNEAFKKTYLLLNSIKGVGFVVAAYMIAITNNFKKFRSARKFNCYAGLAPFKNESGTSIHGRSRVSHLANKMAKCLLNLAAFSAMQHDPELKQYYRRKTGAGYKKMSCTNIIRSKIVARMFAVVKRETPYQIMTPAA